MRISLEWWDKTNRSFCFQQVYVYLFFLYRMTILSVPPLGTHWWLILQKSLIRYPLQYLILPKCVIIWNHICKIIRHRPIWWPTLQFLMETYVYYSVLDYKYGFKIFLLMSFFINILLCLRDACSQITPKSPLEAHLSRTTWGLKLGLHWELHLALIKVKRIRKCKKKLKKL